MAKLLNKRVFNYFFYWHVQEFGQANRHLIKKKKNGFTDGRTLFKFLVVSHLL